MTLTEMMVLVLVLINGYRAGDGILGSVAINVFFSYGGGDTFHFQIERLLERRQP